MRVQSAPVTREVAMALAKEKVPLPDREVRRNGVAAAREAIRLIEHNLLIEEDNPRGYDPYDNPGPVKPGPQAASDASEA